MDRFAVYDWYEGGFEENIEAFDAAEAALTYALHIDGPADWVSCIVVGPDGSPESYRVHIPSSTAERF